MREEDVALMLHESMLVTLKLAGPILAAALAIGLVMSLVQAATQINEATLAFVPKIIAIVATLTLTGSFMFAALNDFAQMIFARIVQVGGS